MSEVDAGPHADLQNTPLGQRDDTPPIVVDLLWISQRAYEMRVGMVFAERHSCLMNCVCPHTAWLRSSGPLTSANKFYRRRNAVL
jgi:hypothetical protein